MFSKACEYGVRACIVVAQHSLSGKRVSLKDIAQATDSPEAFTAKILQKLVKSKLIFSIQGPQGGFEMAQDKIHHSTLADIVNAIDGEAGYTACVLGLKDCSDANPCPAHKKYKHIKSQFLFMIQSTTVLEMVNDIDNGLAFLKANTP